METVADDINEFAAGNNDEITAASAHGAAAADVAEIIASIAVGVVKIAIDADEIAAGVDETAADY